MAKWQFEGRTWWVYEIYDLMGTCLYVGCSHDPELRFLQHTKCRPGKGQGKFYGQQDLTLVKIREFEDRKQALRFEGALKQQHGFEWTERTTLVQCGRRAAESGMLDQIREENWRNNYEKMLRAMRETGRRHTESGHIQRIGAASMARELECPHCGKQGKGAIMGRWHFENCKLK